MYFIGVDPGQGGAIAILSADGSWKFLADWPGDETSVAHCLKVKIMAALLEADFIAAIEDVHSMPKQGVASTFKFGINFGIWRGVFAFAAIPFCLVKPPVWQKGNLRIDDGSKIRETKKGPKRVIDTKIASLVGARRRWPDAELHLKKHHGRADALWIAEWLRLQNLKTGG